ncbi:hypothetical protein Pd630_LPD16184 (plasmid) [Rhodococcus opacus PD630]|nr:hypothetical protein Pd630_LPD16184 [Rhodococcus opacus PD630]
MNRRNDRDLELHDGGRRDLQSGCRLPEVARQPAPLAKAPS